MPAAQLLGAVVACGLWTGVASPGLKLLPGMDGLADDSVAISLQSAVLGIDDGTGRPAEERARAAASVLGLAHGESLLSPAAFRGSAAARAHGTPGPALVRLGAAAAGLLVPPPPPAPTPPTSSALPVARVSPAEPPAGAAEPSAPGAPSSPVPAPVAAAPAPPRPVVPAPSPGPAPVPAPAAPGTQTIEFASAPPATAIVGGHYTVSATASSGLPVKLSIAGRRSACKLSETTVSFREAGTCVVEAHQAGNLKFREARAQQSFAVVRAPQAIVFDSTPPAPAYVGAEYELRASASSGLPVAFSAGAGSAAVCKVSGSRVALIGAGLCAVEADQAGNEAYEPAARVRQIFLVLVPPATLAVQSIAFTSTAPAAGIVGGSVYSPAATASSGLPVSFSADGSAGVCIVTGAAVSFLGEGTCTITAHQPGNGRYAAAPPVQQSFPVERAAQAVSFLSTPPAAAVAGATTYSVAAVASSGLPVVFAVVQSSASVCALAGPTLTAIAPGTCTIEASQPGDGTFQAAPQVQQSFAVGSPAPSLSGQTISFTSAPPATATVGGPGYTVAAAASSGLPVSFSATSGSAGVCSVSGATVSLLGAGTCTIAAGQAGSAAYLPAAPVQQSFAVGRAAQAISFSSTPPVPAAVGDPDYAVSASASSGLPVAFAAAPASAGVCTVSGSNVALVGAGTCTVVASQAGDAVYEPAAAAQQSFTVGPGAPTLSPQTISFTSTAPGSAVVGGAPYTAAAAASSGLAVVFTVPGASAGVCTVAGATVSFVGAGTCTVVASQPGNASYEPASPAQQSFTVSTPPRAGQTISFTSSAPGAAVYGGPPYTISAAATSGLPVVFSAAPSSAGVCTVSGSTVAIAGAGTCTVSADQAGNSSYLPAPQVQQSFAVARAPQSITITSTPPPVDKRSPPYTISATATSGLPVAFAVAPASAAVCSISGASVSFKKKGDCVVQANQGGSSNFLPAPQAQQTIVVQPNV